MAKVTGEPTGLVLMSGQKSYILAILSMSHRKNVLLLLLCAALTAGQKPPAKGVVEVVDSHPTPVIDRTTAKAADIQGGFETGNAVLVQGQ